MFPGVGFRESGGGVQELIKGSWVVPLRSYP